MTKKEKKEPEDNLGKRQKALNAKVNKAVQTKVDFNEIKETSEASDIDKLFKIDVAAKYKNINFIIDVLKSGDSLYITRALNKCLWLYNEDYTHIMNPSYLHSNVFPYMSNKMKKKLLTTVSKHARTEKRAIEFYNYCMKTKLNNIAFKFLLFTPKEFKLNLMIHHNEAPFNEITNKSLDYIKHLINRSFSLLEAFFTMLPERRRHDLILQFKYMYAVSNDKYVEFLEKYVIVQNFGYGRRFDSKLSIDIMTKHKERVLVNPVFFERSVDVNTFVKYTTVEDAKIFAKALLPKTSAEYWKMGFYKKYEHFLKKLSDKEFYSFIKKNYTEHYPESEFEMHNEFYSHNYHLFMTQEEKEEWALRHLKSEKQILGVGCDYQWYQYVNFQMSFEVVKKMILVTNEPRKRLSMINVLVKSARNNQELETLFIYYETRHLNEARSNHDWFLKTVIAHHNVFEFNAACWAAFYKLLINIELYNVLDYKDCNEIYKTVTLFYYILHGLEINEGLTEYLLLHFESNYMFEHLGKLNAERREILYNYLFEYYINQISQFKDQIFSKDLSTHLIRYNKNINALLTEFRKDTFKPVYVKTVYNQPKKERHVDNTLSDDGLLRRLKTDIELIKDVATDLFERFSKDPYRIKNFLKKLKIYYSEDVAKTYLGMFEDLVSKNNSLVATETGVFGIIQLADEKRKLEFINEHVPKNAKIDHEVVRSPELRIQKAICLFACYSRPPLPLASVREYIKGDYVKFCLRMFDMYLAHLPIPMCVQFVESIIDAPVSIQKHGIRLAFKCLNSENLKKTISEIWNKTKNVSLRDIIYKSLYEKLKTESDAELFDVLKSFTLTLHEDDEIFYHFKDNVLPDEYRGYHDEALWCAVGKLKDKQPNIQRKIDVIYRLHVDMYLINEEFIRKVVDEHIQTMLAEKNLHLNYSEEDIKQLNVVKWKLSARYIIHFATFATAPDKYAKVAEDVIGRCVESWNDEYRNINHFQMFCSEFIGYLKEESYVLWNEVQNFETVIPVFESILNTLLKGLPLHDIYMLVWDLRLTIINRRVIQAWKTNLNDKNAWTEIIPKASASFGREVGKLVVEFIESKTYFASFIANITEAISSTAKDLLISLNKYDVTNLEKVLLIVISGLIENENRETYLIAIKLLPDLETDSSECANISDLRGAILKKIKGFSDFEVQSALYAKKYSKRKRYTAEQPPMQAQACIIADWSM